MQSAASRTETEHRLLESRSDFPGTFVAVKNLAVHISAFPDAVTTQTLDALKTVIQSDRFDRQRQVLFLYREAAGALTSALDRLDTRLGRQILESLQSILIKSSGRRRQAVAESLGMLPIRTQQSIETPLRQERHTSVSFDRLTDLLDMDPRVDLHWQGRSLTGKTRQGRSGVIKFARAGEDPYCLTLETGWMACLQKSGWFRKTRFDIPIPIQENECFLMAVTDIPPGVNFPEDLDPDFRAIAFSAAPDYFRYPNTGSKRLRLTLSELMQSLELSALLLGLATSMGIVHTAPIPLFHNRVQQERRQDRGLYDWQRGGRLDRWLDSCAHPNFAPCGLRDFEHFSQAVKGRALIRDIGSHLLSLILVIGSYFRNQQPSLRGFKPDGSPVDVRHLFDLNRFETLSRRCMNAYYQGFTGVRLPPGMDLLTTDLVSRLIDAMGVDSHMEEILRVDDQNRMTPDAFERFLLERGMSQDEIDTVVQGRQDIVLRTGPHLGGFNQPISVPELIDYLFSCSALCISGRFSMENGLN